MSGKQSVTLVVSWSGGAEVEVVSIRHNHMRVPQDALRVIETRGGLRIQYETLASGQHHVAATFSFIGETRRDLRLECLVDGEPAGGAIHVPRAEHRWEARAAWSVLPPAARERAITVTERAELERASTDRPSPRSVSEYRVRAAATPSDPLRRARR